MEETVPLHNQTAAHDCLVHITVNVFDEILKNGCGYYSLNVHSISVRIYTLVLSVVVASLILYIESGCAPLVPEVTSKNKIVYAYSIEMMTMKHCRVENLTGFLSRVHVIPTDHLSFLNELLSFQKEER